jgi:hypothetical protein
MLLGYTTSMKIYVAARFTEKSTVQKLYSQLKTQGHEITADWTAHKNVKPYDQNTAIAGEYSAEDAGGVMAADVFLLLTSAEAGAGVSAELGVAIASKQLTGKPRICVAGEHMATNAFFYHPLVERFATVEQALATL